MNWKLPKVGKLNVNKSIEIQLMLLCNWSCQACDVFSQFPQIKWVRNATLTLGQIDKFIGEMRDHDAYIGRIRLVGGEPTLHPKFAEIVDTLYAALVPEYIGRIEVVTNGSHLEKIAPVKSLISKVRVSNESDKQRSHVANLVTTPAEQGYEGKMCSAPWHCGFSLNYYGYFPCSSGAGIARMRDWMAWQRLELPVAGIMKTWPDLQQLCNHCYHGLKPEHKVRCGTGKEPGQELLNIPSADAQAHLDPWLAGKKPDWKIYGDSAS